MPTLSMMDAIASLQADEVVRVGQVSWSPAELPLLADIEMVALGLTASCPKPTSRILSALGHPTNQVLK